MTETIFSLGTSQQTAGRIVWSSVANGAEENTSVVTAAIQVRKTNGYTTTGTWPGYLTIGSTKKTFSYYGGIGDDWVTLRRFSVTISHNDDGTGSCALAGSISAPNGTTQAGAKVTKSTTITLDTIPRGTTMDSVTSSSEFFTGSISYKYTPKSAAYYNRLVLSVGETTLKTDDLGTLAPQQYTGTMDISEHAADIYEAFPNSNQVVIRLTVRTYLDEYVTQIGEESYADITLRIPEDDTTKPAIEMTLSPQATLPAAFEGLYLQGKSRVTAAFSGTGKYGATISGYTMSVEGKAYSDAFVSHLLSSAKTIEVVGVVTDSRGFKAESRQTITVIPYTPPKVTVAVCGRCDASGTLTEMGTYLKISATRDYKPVVADTQKNYCQLRFRYRKEDGNYGDWTQLLNANDLSSNTVTTAPLLNATLAIDSNWFVEVGVADTVGETSEVITSIPTDLIYDHADGPRRAYRFGGYNDDDDTFAIDQSIVFKAYGDAEVHGSLKLRGVEIVQAIMDAAHPVGSLYWSKNPTDPAQLFGGTWVAVKDTFILAAGDTYSVGAEGGEASHILTTDEMPSHRHTANAVAVQTKDGGFAAMRSATLSQEHDSTSYTNLNGGGQAHNNMPPYKTYYCWERTA